MSNFQKLNLSTKILSALEKKGYVKPTPIQEASIPPLLEGRDLLGIAQTGTGKTAAFALPILDNLYKTKNKVEANNIRALILTPTRELATQIADNIKLYGEDLHLRSMVIFGGVSINTQITNIKKGFDIIVATPGRLLDLINQGQVKFSQLEIFVLDEADRMLDMGFIHDVKKIISKLPKVRQTLFFSATMPKDIALLAEAILNDPIKVEITPQATTVEKIKQTINFVDKGNKSLLLKAILKQKEVETVLVFSKTKHGANRIVESLRDAAIGVAAIHGNKSQSAREKALEEFRQGKIKVLVATDIAARGIDIAGITHVINYDLPHDIESYVHRIGRTARAGREGTAISFCDSSERDILRSIEKLIKFKIPVDDSHEFHGLKSKAVASSPAIRKDSSAPSYKTSKSASQDEKPVSYFGQNRRWKSDDDNNKARLKPSSNRDDKKQMSERRLKSRFNEDSNNRSTDRYLKPATTESTSRRTKFLEFKDEKRSDSYDSKRRYKTNNDDNKSRPKSFFSNSNTQDSVNDHRAKPGRFDSNLSNQSRPPRFKEDSYGRSNNRYSKPATTENRSKKPRFLESSDEKRSNYSENRGRTFNEDRPFKSSNSTGSKNTRFLNENKSSKSFSNASKNSRFLDSNPSKNSRFLASKEEKNSTSYISENKSRKFNEDRPFKSANNAGKTKRFSSQRSSKPFSGASKNSRFNRKKPK
jgi:ATP-dependent RNA helicase RhlE